MKERKVLNQKIKEYRIKEFISQEFEKTGYSHTKIQRTPLGEKITIFTSRPGLVVGKEGENIKRLTNILKKKFAMENPQIEIGEIEKPYLDAQSISERVAYTLEKYGPNRFKSIGYKTLQTIMDAGALGAEIVISGKVPSARSKTWRFIAGYIKKSGEVSKSQVIRGRSTAKLKPGIVGISVNIMAPTVKLPDKIILIEEKPKVVVEETKSKEEKTELAKEAKGDAKEKRTAKAE